MTNFKKLTFYDRAILVASALLFIAGSLGLVVSQSLTLSIILALFYFGLKLIFGQKPQVPKHFLIYVIFLSVLLVHSLITGGALIYFLLFLSGALFWLLGYNYREIFKRYFPIFVIFLGFLMVGLNIIWHLRGMTYQSPDNLFFPIAQYVLHNNLGDLWAIILVFVFYKYSAKKTLGYLMLGIFGVLIMAYSLSRSAVLGFSAGAAYIYFRRYAKTGKKILLLSILAIFVILFLYFGLYKTTLFSRPYYLEAAESLVKNPLGIGIGNFSKVSRESNLTHDLILEIGSGIGLFSITFLFWLYKVVTSLLKHKPDTLYAALFITIFVIFSFDTSYVIPTMLWIWFTSLALL